MEVASWIPTRKWLGALVAGVIALAGTAVATDGWDKEEWGGLVTLASSLSISYFMPNVSTASGTGVPTKQEKII